MVNKQKHCLLDADLFRQEMQDVVPIETPLTTESRLKIMTRQVLRDHPQVLAFTACKPADGGAGAVDVLLRSI